MPLPVSSTIHDTFHSLLMFSCLGALPLCLVIFWQYISHFAAKRSMWVKSFHWNLYNILPQGLAYELVCHNEPIMFSITLSPLQGVGVCVYWQLLANNKSLNDIQDTMGHILACCCCNEHVSIRVMLQLLIAVCLCTFIPTDANLKAVIWIMARMGQRLKSSRTRKKQNKKQTGHEAATMTVWQPIGPICLSAEDVRVRRLSCPHACAYGRYTELTWCGRHE